MHLAMASIASSGMPALHRIARPGDTAPGCLHGCKHAGRTTETADGPGTLER